MGSGGHKNSRNLNKGSSFSPDLWGWGEFPEAPTLGEPRSFGALREKDELRPQPLPFGPICRHRNFGAGGGAANHSFQSRHPSWVWGRLAAISASQDDDSWRWRALVEPVLTSGWTSLGWMFRTPKCGKYTVCVTSGRGAEGLGRLGRRLSNPLLSSSWSPSNLPGG